MPVFLQNFPFLFSLGAAAIAGGSAVLLRRAGLVLGRWPWRLSWAASAGSTAAYAWSFSWAWQLETNPVGGAQVIFVVVGWLAVLAGSALGLWGLSTLGWRAVLPRPEDRLEIHPPYAHLRRPMALGAMLAGLGATFIVSTLSAWLCYLVWLALASLLLELEEWELRGRIPAARDYFVHTPRYLPRLRPRQRR